MNHWGEVVLVVLALGMAIFIQLRVSKMCSSVMGLILPFLIFLFSLCVFVQDLLHIISEKTESLSLVTAAMYFALYNIPTILFLCIYNYYQRTRLARYK